MDNGRTLARIERAGRDLPFCECGQPMAPVARSREIWLECSSGRRQAGRGMRRLLAAMSASSHTRRLIVGSADLS